MSKHDLPDLAEAYRAAELDAAIRPDQLQAGYVAALEADLRELGARLVRERELADLRVQQATDAAARAAEQLRVAHAEGRTQREYLGQALGHLAWVRGVLTRLAGSKHHELAGNARAWVLQAVARLGEMGPTELGTMAPTGAPVITTNQPYSPAVGIRVAGDGVTLDCRDGVDVAAWVTMLLDEQLLLRWLLAVQRIAARDRASAEPV